ncbi:hypothetical protein CF327_g4419 [Tilletia walkeri]|nr:hypothetical protein CF327_g4419 [Tilletia walkeri]
MNCLLAEATTTVPLPLLVVNEGSAEGVAELLQDSALLLGVLEVPSLPTDLDVAERASVEPSETGDPRSVRAPLDSALSRDEEDPM